ncbi:IclR family transcriptional regulator [Neobacillus dielmonensis]|uniref:IclR family transcriptional regulator n=1 Tax=Neobacillus dielmonensis TaxID=1347369 RepID=UPI0005A5D42D|nr:IclR family transcriptional regulator [Neobacillus dielmonensis]
MTETKQLYGTVLIKADQILAYLSSTDTPQTLNQIAKGAGLTNSTALKILDTLVVIGYVRKDEEAKKFKLGPSLIRYANRAMNQYDIKELAQPYLKQLQIETGETVHLGVKNKSHIVYISKLESNKPICLYSQIGKNLPLYCSAMGKAVLAEQPDSEIEAYIDETEFTRFTQFTITEKQPFMDEMNRIRKLGYAFDNREHEDEVFCIGMSLSINEKNFGAFSVSIPFFRINEPFLHEILTAMKKCKQNIVMDLEAAFPL